MAKPELKVQSGGEGSIAFGEKSQAVVAFTPTVRGDDIDFAFDITDGEKRLSPTLRISKTVPGSMEWMSPAHGQKTVGSRCPGFDNEAHPSPPMTSDITPPLVLVVDDDTDTRELYRMVLESVGYRVEDAASVSSADAALARVGPDVVLTDWLLPDGNGLDVCRALGAGS